MEPVRWLYCYARSGGTLLNQCLAAMPDTVVMSEVSTFGNGTGKENISLSLQEQAKKWYGIELRSKEFYVAITELLNHCNQIGKKLIIREWIYASYHAIESNRYNPPKSLQSIQRLTHLNIPVQSIALVRNTYDVWISRGTPRMNTFAEQYSNYVKDILRHKIKIYKYEDFCTNPLKEMKSICDYLKIPFDTNFIHTFHKQPAQGDTQVKDRDSRINRTIIVLPPRKFIMPHHLILLYRNKLMQKINNALVYEEFYFSRKYTVKLYIISFLEFFRRHLYTKCTNQ